MCPKMETGYGQYNSGNYCNPKVDELTMLAQSETNLDSSSSNSSP
jgi:peptide/nickel transport system substrate-binding protein